MDKIPTAEEYIEAGNYPDSISGGTLYSVMIDFAKLHVKAALLSAALNAKSVGGNLAGTTARNRAYVDQNSILSSYPLTQIK